MGISVARAPLAVRGLRAALPGEQGSQWLTDRSKATRRREVRQPPTYLKWKNVQKRMPCARGTPECTAWGVNTPGWLSEGGSAPVPSRCASGSSRGIYFLS